MIANAVVYDMFPCPEDPDKANHVVNFTATDDPRSGQVTISVSMSLSLDEIHLAIRQGIANFINEQRGAIVIEESDVRLL